MLRTGLDRAVNDPASAAGNKSRNPKSERPDNFERDFAARLRAVRIAEEQKQVRAGADMLAEGEVDIRAQTAALVGSGLVDDPCAEAAFPAQEVVAGENSLRTVRTAEAQAVEVQLEREGARHQDTLIQREEVVKFAPLTAHGVADRATLIESPLAPAKAGLVGMVVKVITPGLVDVDIDTVALTRFQVDAAVVIVLKEAAGVMLV
jgi:hypothetical protein